MKRPTTENKRRTNLCYHSFGKYLRNSVSCTKKSSLKVHWSKQCIWLIQRCFRGLHPPFNLVAFWFFPSSQRSTICYGSFSCHTRHQGCTHLEAGVGPWLAQLREFPVLCCRCFCHLPLSLRREESISCR